MVLMPRKSQAALEFLTTYGWAFLVILIMIGALAYFGILNPTKVLPNRCNFGAEFQCVDYQMNASGLKLKLKSNVGRPINIYNISIESETTAQLTCGPYNTSSASAWRSGELKDINIGGCNYPSVGILQGEKGKVFVTVKFYETESGPSYMKIVNGEVLTTVV